MTCPFSLKDCIQSKSQNRLTYYYGQSASEEKYGIRKNGQRLVGVKQITSDIVADKSLAIFQLSRVFESTTPSTTPSHVSDGVVDSKVADLKGGHVATRRQGVGDAIYPIPRASAVFQARSKIKTEAKVQD